MFRCASDRPATHMHQPCCCKLNALCVNHALCTAADNLWGSMRVFSRGECEDALTTGAACHDRCAGFAASSWYSRRRAHSRRPSSKRRGDSPSAAARRLQQRGSLQMDSAAARSQKGCRGRWYGRWVVVLRYGRTSSSSAVQLRSGRSYGACRSGEELWAQPWLEKMPASCTIGCRKRMAIAVRVIWQLHRCGKRRTKKRTKT
jgi:hypothetical protein